MYKNNQININNWNNKTGAILTILRNNYQNNTRSKENIKVNILKK